MHSTDILRSLVGAFLAVESAREAACVPPDIPFLLNMASLLSSSLKQHACTNSHRAFQKLISKMYQTSSGEPLVKLTRDLECHIQQGNWESAYMTLRRLLIGSQMDKGVAHPSTISLMRQLESVYRTYTWSKQFGSPKYSNFKAIQSQG